jgi:hemoglobin
MDRFSTIDEAAIAALVRRFYAKVRQDDLIGPLFEAAVDDWEAHFVKLAAFWSNVMLGTRRYQGNPMAAHMKQPIRAEFFDRWLGLWQETAAELFEPDAAAAFRDKAGRIAESLKLGLFYRPGRTLDAVARSS